MLGLPRSSQKPLVFVRICLAAVPWHSQWKRVCICACTRMGVGWWATKKRSSSKVICFPRRKSLVRDKLLSFSFITVHTFNLPSSQRKRKQQLRGLTQVLGQMERNYSALGQGCCNEVACHSVNSEDHLFYVMEGITLQ